MKVDHHYQGIFGSSVEELSIEQAVAKKIDADVRILAEFVGKLTQTLNEKGVLEDDDVLNLLGSGFYKTQDHFTKSED